MNQNKNNLTEQYSGFFLAFEPARSKKIAEKIYLDKEISESFSSIDWKFELREVVLLSLTPKKSTIDAIVFMEGMHGTGGTGKRKMRLYSPIFIDKPVSALDLKEIVKLEKIVSTAEAPRRIELLHWKNIIAALKQLRPNIAGELQSMLERKDESHRLIGDDSRSIRLMEQRDAIGMALELASLDRQTILKNLDLKKVGNATSILDLLDHEPLHEQDLIRKDQQVFQNLLSQDMRQGCFNGPSGRQVRVYVYDKKILETVLGVDLLIYQESYQSFLLIQYKVMDAVTTRSGKTWSYFVNEQLLKQIEAMDKGLVKISKDRAHPNEMKDWRLDNGAFYFKFCEITRPDAREDALVRGITLGLDHLKKFLNLPQSKGKAGGQRIGYENCPRYLNNTQFLELARDGWIGCDQSGYAVISKIIKAGQEGGKMAMLAVIEGSGVETALDRRKTRK